MTIDRAAGAKLAQDLPFGLYEWTQRYRNSRSSNEGFNGLAKKTAPVDISDPNLRRIRGVAAQSILIAFQLAAINLRRIDSFLKEHLADPDFEKKDARRDKRRAKSRPFGPRESARGKSPPPGVVVPS